MLVIRQAHTISAVTQIHLGSSLRILMIVMKRYNILTVGERGLFSSVVVANLHIAPVSLV